MSISKQLSNNKIPVISFCCKYKVMSPKSVAVADDVREEVMKHCTSLPQISDKNAVCAVDLQHVHGK